MRMPDFFISYTASDERWAEWIAWRLEEAGFKTVLQKWDFAAGSNFVIEMQRAASDAKRTIAVLSPAYLKVSRFGAAEWASAFARDPDGLGRTLVPVRVEECAGDGLLKGIVYIDLVGLDENAAREKLLDYVKGVRRKPTTPPAFPGPASGSHTFPESPASLARPRYMPMIRGTITDADRRRFMRSAFAEVQQRFEQSLAELNRQHASIETDFQVLDATTFTAEIYVAGKSRANCKIWMGGLLGGKGIAYAEGHTAHISASSLNEELSLVEDKGELRLNAMMGAGFLGRATHGLDLQKLTIEEAGEYLWRRFSSPVER